MLLSYTELLDLIAQGVIDAPIENVNAASIDVTLGNEIMVAPYNGTWGYAVDLANKENIQLEKKIITPDGYILSPGEFILATTVEWFDFSKRNDLSAEYKLKSSMARNGLSHLLAGWMDSGWSGNLTLEFHNVAHEPLLLRAGMKCGQAIFIRHAPVPDYASYAVKGQYNAQSGVQASKGIR
jgi:dCTP deaminase